MYIHISVENFIKYDLSVHHHYRIHQYVHSSFYRVRLVCTLPTSSTSICPQQLNQERLVFTVSLSCTSMSIAAFIQSTICLYSIIIVYIIMSITAFTKYDLSLQPRSGELRTQKLKSHLVRTQSLNVLPFKPGVGQYIAIHATLTARDFFLAYFYPSSPFTCIFSKTSPNFFLCWPAE